MPWEIWASAQSIRTAKTTLCVCETATQVSKTDDSQARISNLFECAPNRDYPPGQPDHMRARRGDIHFDRNRSKAVTGGNGRSASRVAPSNYHSMVAFLRIISARKVRNRPLWAEA